MKLDLKRLNTLDRAIVGGGFVVFIAGFLPWYGYSGPLPIYNASVSGWSAGFTGWASVLLLTLVGVFHLLRRSEVGLPTLPIGPSVLVAGVSGLGLLLVIIRWLTFPSVSAGAAGSIGARYGIWVALIAALVETGGAVMAMRASGEPLPWAASNTATPAPGQTGTEEEPGTEIGS